MIGLDTNILVRYFTRDNLIQLRIVNEFVDKVVVAKKKLWINHIVICELVWVLEECYRYGKEDILNAIFALANVFHLEMEAWNGVLRALQDYQAHSLHFFDCLIGQSHHFNKCIYTVTCDKKASRLKTFRNLKASS